jgi:hypothetical protein
MRTSNFLLKQIAILSPTFTSFVSCSQVFFACGSYFQNKVQRS